jgi:formate dehydrogenase subunit gamma
MEGALDSMRSGYVDETWAREHHAYWYRQVKGEGAPHYAPAPPPPITPQTEEGVP